MDVAVSSTETFISTYSGNVTATLGNISPKMARITVRTKKIPKLPPVLIYGQLTRIHSVYFGKKRPINGDTPLKAESSRNQYPTFSPLSPTVVSNTSEPTKYHVKMVYTVEKSVLIMTIRILYTTFITGTFLAEKLYIPKQVQSVTTRTKE